MALLFSEDFEGVDGNVNSLTARGWKNIYADTYHFLDSSIVRSGTYSLRVSDNMPADAIASRFLPGTPSSVSLGFGFYVERLPGSDALVMVDFRDQNDTINISLTCRPSGQITVRRGTIVSGTKLATSLESVICAKSWQHIEVYLLLSKGSGSVEVRVEGEVVLTFTGDTVSSPVENQTADMVNGLPSIAYIGFVGAENAFRAGSGDVDAYYDDIYAYDSSGSYVNNWTGDLQIETLRPSADTAVAEWTGSYTDINGTDLDGDGSYIYSGGGSPSAVTSQFEMDNVSSTIGPIVAVESFHYVRNDGSGGTSFQEGIISGGVTSIGTVQIASPYYEFIGSIWYLDPNSGVGFTGTDVNNLKIQVSGG